MTLPPLLLARHHFPELLELHLARKPTPEEVALLTLRFGETGLQLDNWLQWLQFDKPAVAAPSVDPDQAAASDPTNLGSNLCRGNVSSVESTACDEQPVEMEPHIIANAKATFKALDADGDGECHLPTLSARQILPNQSHHILVHRGLSSWCVVSTQHLKNVFLCRVRTV